MSEVLSGRIGFAPKPYIQTLQRLLRQPWKMSTVQVGLAVPYEMNEAAPAADLSQPQAPGASEESGAVQSRELPAVPQAKETRCQGPRGCRFPPAPVT